LANSIRETNIPFTITARSIPAFALAILALSGCVGASRGPKSALTRFPIGIYQADDPKHLARLKQDGFDSILPYTNDPARLAALAKEANRQQMRIIAAPNKVIKEDSALTRDWPIDAWYLFDEPDVGRMSSTTLQGISDKTRAWDPLRPQAFVIGQGSPARVYGHIGDILMMDWYPVPHKPADSVADQIDLVIPALPKGKPFWMVIQAYDWADEVTDPERLKLGGGLRFPNRSEIRFMSYLSIIHGARGLYYFCLRKKDKTLFDYPDLWGAVSSVSREIKAMQPVFEQGKPIPLPFESKTPGLEAMALRYRMRDYVIILNRRKDALIKMPDELHSRKWHPMFESGHQAKEVLTPARGAWYLQPYRVMVFESRLRL